VAWSPNGKYLAALSYFGTTITVWDTQTWGKVNEFTRNGGFYCDSSFGFLTNNSVVTTAPLGPSPDPKYDVLAKFFNVEEWDIHTGKLLRCLPEEPIHNPDTRYSPRMDTFTVSSNHDLIAGVETGIYSNTVSVLNIITGKQLFSRVIPIEWGVDLSESKSLKSEGIHTLAFSKDGKRLAVGTGARQVTRQNKTLAGGGHVYILNSRTGKILKSFWAYRWKPDNYRDQPDADGFIPWRPQDIYKVRRIIFSPDGRWVVTAKEKYTSTRTGNRVAATIFNARTGAKVTDIQGKVIRDLGKDEVLRINAMVWDGNRLAVGDESGAFRLYSVKDPRKPLLIYNDDPEAGGVSTRSNHIQHEPFSRWSGRV
jgi:WD40 repeat protein